MTEPDEHWSRWFSAAWAHREDVVYPELFGAPLQGIYVMDPTLYLETFAQESFDPRWLHSGVFESAPNSAHDSWLYVSSGLSNPWEDETPDPQGVSGLGCEFVFESSLQGAWAILRVQHLIAFQTLLCHGRFPGKEPLGVFDRIPLRAPLTPEPSALRWLMLAPPVRFPSSVRLHAGTIDLLQVVGITDAEAQFARETSGQALIDVLSAAGAFPVTDPSRTCTIAPT